MVQFEEKKEYERALVNLQQLWEILARSSMPEFRARFREETVFLLDILDGALIPDDRRKSVLEHLRCIRPVFDDCRAW